MFFGVATFANQNLIFMRFKEGDQVQNKLWQIFQKRKFKMQIANMKDLLDLDFQSECHPSVQ
jgi:hypothetical protein